jgi:hypothetical protein
VFDYVTGQAAHQKAAPETVTFSRRELREALKWSEYQLRTHLDELAQLEYVLPLSGRQGQPFRYRLLYDGQGESGDRFLSGLKSVEQLGQEAAKLGIIETSQAAASENRGAASRCLRGQKEPLRGQKTNFEGTSLNRSNEVKPPFQPAKSRVLANGPGTSRVLPGNLYPVNGERSTSNV